MNPLVRPRDPARRALTTVIALLAPAAFVLTWWVVADALPSRLATHFDVSGEPNGYSATTGFVAGMAAMVLLVAAVGAGVLWVARAPVRFMAAVLIGAAWLLAGVGIAVLLAAREVVSPTDISLSPTWALGVAAAGVVGGVLAWWLTGSDAASVRPVEPVDAPYTLGSDERAVWIGTTSSTPFRVLGVLSLLVAVAAAFLGAVAIVTPAALAIGVTASWCSRLTVRIDSGGLLAHYGFAPWPRTRVRLNQITQVRVDAALRPLEWGGWGYRISPRGTGMILRGGPGLVVTRANGRDLAISVDDPQVGADLVHALIEREAASR